MILLSGLSLVLLSVLLGQIGPAYVAQKSTRTVYAAQAGLQAGLGVIRSATAAPVGGVIWGAPAKLPCILTGRLNATSDGVDYAVEFKYFKGDPTGKDAAWQTSPTNRISCSPSTGLGEAPMFALLSSEGRAAATPGSAASVGNRKVTATYQFKVSNENIPGGRIYTSDKSRCLEWGGGDKLQFVAGCAAGANDSKQLWVYDVDYKLKLASTTAAGATAMCITDSADEGNKRDKEEDAKLKACRSDASRWSQLWSWEGGAIWRGQLESISGGPSGRCLAPKDRFVANTACNGAFAPEPAVGAGAAGFTTKQIVNFKEFGRCADVTNEKIDYSFMITYLCKQDPSGNLTGKYLKWNHKWRYIEPVAPATARPDQQIIVNFLDKSPADNRCLQTPDNMPATVELRFFPCNSLETKQKWTRYSETGDPQTSYTFVDVFGRCMSAVPTVFASPDAVLTNVASKVQVQACNGSTAQKWNAPATYTQANFGSFSETSG
ncbi:hypothetical protein BHD05_04550 [Marisediminicola antarctica]|uniref:Ricin B lectin domain-containing protein n=2 Tax=Marisediminicola antarctica TaxID=674079 RepID=A0A7L5AF11_9MICO|nr:hypothetical protein BHD05_04550 [Marisediminicola antarctica]